MTDEEMFALLEYTLIEPCEKQMDFMIPCFPLVKETGQYLMFRSY